MTPPILSIKNTTISFAKKTLFEDLNLNLFTHDRICLIGKNGAGKTTLMNAITNRLEFDSGERFIMPNTTLGYLEQSEKIAPNLTLREYILQNIKIDDHKTYLIDTICQKLQLDQNTMTHDLSGGEKRRAGLAKILVFEPDILLLDEPTNHLDLDAIKWLENYLKTYRGALIIISHDRKFLEKTTNKIFWLRAGSIKINNQGYAKFDEWSGAIIDQENREMQNLEKKFDLERNWLEKGVTARRKRNIGRLHYINDLRQKINNQKQLVKANQSNIKIHASDKIDNDAPQVIASLNNVSKNFADKKIIENFDLKILRGEKIGIIGNNGSGKSTFLKMLIGEIKPDQGTIKLARDLEFSYFDQNRSAINKNTRIKDILCPDGSDYVKLGNGKVKHICGYLRDFLFDPQDSQTLASTLSGGQQNRLILAKTLANPKNFLILDEPTNDLDMDSLDILQNYLEKYQGTALIVSHDRDFLDQTITSILAFEGNAKITTHLGGYSDYLQYKEKTTPTKPKTIEEPPKKPKKKPQNELKKLKNELNRIPDKIEKLETEIYQLNDELLTTDDRNPANLAQISIEIGQKQQKIDTLEQRWLEIEEELAN